MNNKELAIITIAIIVGCCIIGGFIYAGLATNDSANNDTIANNTTNTTNKTINDTSNSSDTSQDSKTTQQKEEYTYSPQSDSYVKNSGEDYDTGSVDKNGEKVYAHRWTDNGVTYETYKSESGREISSEEYYN